MKTLKSAAALFAMLCLMASCNKEEPKKTDICDCNTPKIKEREITGKLSVKNNQISITRGSIDIHIACNFNETLSKIKDLNIGQDSIVTSKLQYTDCEPSVASYRVTYYSNITQMKLNK
jgi:hypothetical protein